MKKQLRMATLALVGSALASPSTDLTHVTQLRELFDAFAIAYFGPGEGEPSGRPAAH